MIFLDPCRLTRSVSAPRRCLCCHKMVYFTGVRCRLCGIVTHKSCSNHPCQPRRSSCQPSLDSVGSSIDGSLEQITRLPAEEDDVFAAQKAGAKSGAISGFLKVANWLIHRRKSKDSSSAQRRKMFLRAHRATTSSPSCSVSSSDGISSASSLPTTCGGGPEVGAGAPGKPRLVKARTLSVEPHPGGVADPLCATWPQSGQSLTTLGDVSEDTESGIVDCGGMTSNTQRCAPDVRDTLGEWCIPYQDLEVGEPVRTDVHRGRWHGEVMIYIFRDSDVGRFLDDVAQMSLIRHENVVLFMGACIEPPRLAVITSMRKGPSLYEQLHLKKHRLPFHSKVNIARQVAQGMGYLHAKGIIHRKLCSKNILLENRVKLCIMDQSGVPKKHMGDHQDCAPVPRGALSYLSPELVRSLAIAPPHVRLGEQPTLESDVYAYGSVLYELFTEKFAFSSQHPHAIIWQVGTGHLAPLQSVPPSLKTLVRECWSTNPSGRPPFTEILRYLQENVSLHSRHSSSEPERLHQSGLRC